MEDGSPFDHDDLPEDFYSTNTFTDKLLEKLKIRTEQEAQRPFFATLAFTAPHWPLQAPKHVVDKYRGMYDQGPDELAKSRLRRMIELGIASETEQAPPPVGNPAYGWSSMTADERARSARAMEVYAAMVEVVDDNVGRTLEYLREAGELDNTFVLFMSDNGAEGASLEAAPVSPDVHLFVSRQNLTRTPPADHGRHQDNVVHLREVL
jgi:arylsulfatase A-like enzyme